MRKIITIACGLTFTVATVSALNIDLTPGGMVEKYADLANTKDTSLVLTGEADVRDMAFLKNMSESITSVDMSSLQINAYTYPEGDNYMGMTSFEADVLPPYVFTGSHIKSIVLPSRLQKIGDSAFVASQLQSVSFPSMLKEIGNYAFANADNLKSAVFPSKVVLGVGVFKDCDSLADVEINYDITEIPDFLFDGCSSYAGEIPYSVTSIGKYAYRGTAVESLDLSNVRKIDDYAFADMKNLREIEFSTSGQMDLGVGIFFNDSGLESLPLMNSDFTTSLYAHTGGATKRYYINTKNIGQAAFANNTEIDSLIFGSNVSYIGAHAFRNINTLLLIDVEELGSNVIDVDVDAFSGLLNENGRYDIALNVENGTDDDWNAHEVWTLFNIGHFDVGVDDIVSESNVDIAVRRNGNSLDIVSTHDIDYVGIYSLNGMMLHEATPHNTVFAISDVNDSDIIIVKVISGGISKIIKLK